LVWVDEIFAKLTVRYGRDFLGRYEGQDLSVVKADWAEELAGLQGRPDAIKYALDYCGNKPPNVLEFREVCQRAPTQFRALLEAPRASQGAIDKALAAAQMALQKKGDVLDPIRALRRRELEGDKTLTKFQRDFWRIALKKELEAQQ